MIQNSNQINFNQFEVNNCNDWLQQTRLKILLTFKLDKFDL